MQTSILRYCFSLPKVSFFLHTYPSIYTSNFSLAFDNTMLEAMSDLIGKPLSNWSWLKASLPHLPWWSRCSVSSQTCCRSLHCLSLPDPVSGLQDPWFQSFATLPSSQSGPSICNCCPKRGLVFT